MAMRIRGETGRAQALRAARLAADAHGYASEWGWGEGVGVGSIDV